MDHLNCGDDHYERRRRFSSHASDQMNRLQFVLHDIDEMCRDLGNKPTGFKLTWMAAALCAFYAVQFIVISWTANQDGTFNFSTSNLWLSVAILGLITSFSFIPFDFFSSNRFKSHLRNDLIELIIGECIFSSAMILALVAAAQVSPAIGSALWFTRICGTEFWNSMFSFAVPVITQMSLLASVLLLVVLYTLLVMQGGTATSMFGIYLFLISVWIAGLCDVTQTRLLSETLSDLKDKEKMAFSFAIQIPVWVPFIILEGYVLRGTFVPYDLIPFYGYDFKAYCLCVFQLSGTFLCWKIQASDITLFILLAYTGTIIGVGLSYWYKGLSTFHLPTCILSVVIFLITVTYAYMSSIHERINAIEGCVQKIREARLPQHRAFRKLSVSGLMVLKDRLLEEEKAINTGDYVYNEFETHFEFGHIGGHRKASSVSYGAAHFELDKSVSYDGSVSELSVAEDSDSDSFGQAFSHFKDIE